MLGPSTLSSSAPSKNTPHCRTTNNNSQSDKVGALDDIALLNNILLDGTRVSDGRRRCSLRSNVDTGDLGIFLNSRHSSDLLDLEEVDGQGEQMNPRVVVEDVRYVQSLKSILIALSGRAEYQHIDFHTHLDDHERAGRKRTSNISLPPSRVKRAKVGVL